MGNVVWFDLTGAATSVAGQRVAVIALFSSLIYFAITAAWWCLKGTTHRRVRAVAVNGASRSGVTSRPNLEATGANAARSTSFVAGTANPNSASACSSTAGWWWGNNITAAASDERR